eukprot:TRINITY_DN12290_c0_g1_i1.p2 TRINITY_DN12290_c0_g1~~TRINITY_DN12290_c0_g1_i1.p2  ORF type:complete len:137 (-),score=24.79 TRINITY_DN12290_c0_g1_i1:337-747(-)
MTMIWAAVEVKPSPILGPGQLGAFAAQDLEADAVVVAMEQPRRVTQKQVERIVAETGLPRDAFPQVPHTKPAFRFDLRLLEGRTAWYCLNHSWKPNLRMQVQGRDGLQWVTLRPIKKGEELTYDYGQPDRTWSREI